MIEKFAGFCELLAQPENHIKIYPGQYVERHVNTRTYVDMSNEMSQALVRLERFSTYAKVICEQNGERVVVTQKIKTNPMPAVRGGEAAERYLQKAREDIWDNTLEAGLVGERSQIEEEIRHRQHHWHEMALDEPPRQSTGKLESSLPSAVALFDPDEPPPRSSSAQTSEALADNAPHETADRVFMRRERRG
jgi:hypothetical protein